MIAIIVSGSAPPTRSFHARRSRLRNRALNARGINCLRYRVARQKVSAALSLAPASGDQRPSRPECPSARRRFLSFTSVELNNNKKKLNKLKRSKTLKAAT